MTRIYRLMLNSLSRPQLWYPLAFTHSFPYPPATTVGYLYHLHAHNGNWAIHLHPIPIIHAALRLCSDLSISNNSYVIFRIS